MSSLFSKLCLRVVRACLGVGLFGPAGGGLVGCLAGGGLVGGLVGGRLEATLRKGGGWGLASSHFGKAVKGVTTTEPGRGVGLPKLVLLLSKVPGSQMDQ